MHAVHKASENNVECPSQFSRTRIPEMSLSVHVTVIMLSSKHYPRVRNGAATCLKENKEKTQYGYD